MVTAFSLLNTGKTPHLFPSFTFDNSYHRCRPTATQPRSREVGSDGCYWSIVCLSQQAVYVAGQTGGGAHSMVPQDEDGIVQSVQAILHPRLGAPRGMKRGARGRRGERRTEQLNISTLRAKIEDTDLMVWSLAKEKKTPHG